MTACLQHSYKPGSISDDLRLDADNVTGFLKGAWAEMAVESYSLILGASANELTAGDLTMRTTAVLTCWNSH